MTKALPKALCLLLALSMLPAFAIATSAPTSMTVALISDPNLQLYPLRMSDRNMLSMMDLVYESLFVLDDSRNPVMSLCTDYSVTNDGRVWTFTIREGVTFHDGREVTAYDVTATMDSILYIASDSSLADNEKGLYYKFVDIWKSWKADDKYTLTVQAERPFYGLLYTMTFPVLQAQSVLSENPPGCGPYRIVYYLPGEEIWLAGNENWYGPAPHVSEIVGRWYATDEDALKAYEAETVDIVMTRSPAATRYRGSASTRSNAYDYGTRQLECLMINNGAKYVRDREIREAIVTAINKTRLISNVYQNMVTSADTIQPPVSWLNNEGATTYNYNPDDAATILNSEALGWNNFNDEGHRFRKTDTGENEVLVLRLCYYDESGTSLRKEAAEEIARMLRAVGFRIRVISYSFEDAVQKLKSGDYELFLCAYNFDIVPDPSFIFLSNGAGNYARYQSPECQEYIKNLRQADDPDEFKQLWFSIQAQMNDDIAFLPLYWRDGVLISRYPFSNVRDIREFELLKSINQYK